MTKLECVDRHQACDSIALNGMCTSRHIPNVMQICTKSCNPECGGGVNVGCPIQCKQMIGCKNFVLEPKNSKGSGIGLQCGNWDEAMEKKGAMIAYNCENPACSEIATTSTPSAVEVAPNGPSPLVGSSCVDNNTSCAQMVHLCNIDFVSKNCARSCNPSCSSNAATTSLVTTTAPLVQSAAVAVAPNLQLPVNLPPVGSAQMASMAEKIAFITSLK